MRLNSAARLQQIILLGLSEPVFRAAKNLLAIGEKLKEAEQSLIFYIVVNWSKFFLSSS